MMSQYIPQRINTLRTTLAKYPEDLAILTEQIGLTDPLTRLDQHAQVFAAAATAEETTDIARADAGRTISTAYQTLLAAYRQTKNLLEWYLERHQAGLFDTFDALPYASRADERTQTMLSFTEQHAAALTSSTEVVAEIARLQQTLSAYQAARAALPEAAAAEDAADADLRSAWVEVDLYLDCLERTLRRVLVGQLDKLYDYGLRQRPTVAPAADAPVV